MKKLAFILLLIIGLSLVAYGMYRAPAAQAAVETPVQTHTPQPPVAEEPISTPSLQQMVVESTLPVQDTQSGSLPETTLMDEQGAIIVERGTQFRQSCGMLHAEVTILKGY